MDKAFDYYEKTKNTIARMNVRKFMDMEIVPGRCIDLGCGAGNDTIFLIKNGWKVTAIDKEDTEMIIKNYLNKEEQKSLEFIKSDFENINLKSCDLLIANFSLPFCKKDYFEELWEKIEKSIIKNGYFVGNFLGINDTWINKPNMIFLRKEEVLNLFSSFNIIKFYETEKDAKTALGTEKHWHIFDVIAKKK